MRRMAFHVSTPLLRLSLLGAVACATPARRLEGVGSIPAAAPVRSAFDAEPGRPGSGPASAREHGRDEGGGDGEEGGPAAAASPIAPAARPGAPGRAADGARAPLLVYTARLTLAVYEVVPGLRAVEAIARELGGFLSRQSGGEITIRVPAARFDEALGRAESLGDVLHRQVAADDVTQEHQDLGIRIRNARATRDRLEALLARAAKVDEAIAIERELARVARELESLEGRLKFLADRIAFSTITVVFSARRTEAVSQDRVRLPFPWLGELGLGRLLDLGARGESR
jgi:hypothetical protein